MARTPNPMGRSRKPGSAYITTEDPRTGWRYEVLKTWQTDGTKPFARAFCNVHGFATEMGDVYVADIGRVILDFDQSVFPSEAVAHHALFGYAVVPKRDRGRPELGKVYALTGPGPTIQAGNTWAESERPR